MAGGVSSLPAGLGQITGDMATALSIALQHLLVAGAGSMSQADQCSVQYASSLFANVGVLFNTAFQAPISYADTSAAMGASLGSNVTGGGPASPLAGTNPFNTLAPQPSSLIKKSSAALHAIAALKASDPVLEPLPAALVRDYLLAIVDGVRIG